MPPSKVAPEKRAAAIAALQAGEQPAVVADQLGIDPDVVRQWKQRYVTNDVTAHVTVTPSPIRNPTIERQQAEIGVLVLDLLASKLEASKAIAAAVSDPAWIRTQAASELATLGEWLDATAFAIGDRLAGRKPADDSPGD